MNADTLPGDVTRVLTRVAGGDNAAVGELMSLVHGELHGLARGYLRRESAGHTLQPTALVNEAYLKLVQQDRVDWQGRSHFFAVGAQAMRRILVDHARTKAREKRGGGRERVTLDEAVAFSPRQDEDVLALDQALTRLSERHPRQARIVELRFFGGLQLEEVAELLGVSRRTVAGDWRLAKAWLRRELSEGS